MENENELTLCIEMFEAWAKTKGLEIHPYINAWTEKVDYQHSHINAMWDGWQAAWNTRNPAPSRMPENEANKNVGDLVEGLKNKLYSMIYELNHLSHYHEKLTDFNYRYGIDNENYRDALNDIKSIINNHELDAKQSCSKIEKVVNAALSTIRQQSSVKVDLVPEYAKEGDYIYATIKAYHPNLTESEMELAGHTHYLGQVGGKSSVKVDDGLFHELLRDLEWVLEQKWLSADKDNMEFKTTVTYFFLDKIRDDVARAKALRSSEMPNGSGKED